MQPKYSDGFLSRNLENCRKKNSCEGGGQGEVKVVRVLNKNVFPTYDWGYWTYSEEAIEEDKRRGLTVLLDGDEGFQS